MKTYSEIRDIITKQLGLNNLNDYVEWTKQWLRDDNPRIPTPEDIALLDPDLIDNHFFWKVVEELFGTDPVANCQGAISLSKIESNRGNLAIYRWDGILGIVEDIASRINPTASLLEIGPGYGTLKNWVEANTRLQYYGADVYPKIDGVEETEPSGLMKPETKAKKYDVIVSCNVFQHLSVNQRRSYYQDISSMLNPNGLFMFSMMYDREHQSKSRDLNGRLWVNHYGQFTEIQKGKDIIDDILPFFNLESLTYRGGYWIVLLCSQKST